MAKARGPLIANQAVGVRVFCVCLTHTVHVTAAVATQVRFKHVDTNAYLYSHDAKYGNPIAGQVRFVMCVQSRSAWTRALIGVNSTQLSTAHLRVPGPTWVSCARGVYGCLSWLVSNTTITLTSV